jgi:hypothetical protein
MTTNDKRDRARIKRVALEIADMLRLSVSHLDLRVLRSSQTECSQTDTSGWAIEIARLGRGKPDLEIWIDRFTGHAERKLYACFYSTKRDQIEALAKQSPKAWNILPLGDEDLVTGKSYSMRRRLPAKDFNRPLLELYAEEGHYFFGFYDPTRGEDESAEQGFCNTAVEFFREVLEQQPSDLSPIRDYPKVERRLVTSHLRHERNSYLAEECKRRDKHRCQVCKLAFSERYGAELGSGFAEAHHRRALKNLPDIVETLLEDLVTVCANCHRMLHRMEGLEGDIAELRRIVADKEVRHRSR